MGLSGVAIGIFKTGALALIGDLSSSTTQHTSIMNMLEGFFGIGAIVGPALLTQLLAAGLSWTWLYLLAGTLCVGLIVVALARALPRGDIRGASQRRIRAARPGDEESVRPGVLDGRVSLRRRRGRHLRLDADAAGGIRGIGGDAGRLQRVGLLLCCARPGAFLAPGC